GDAVSLTILQRSLEPIARGNDGRQKAWATGVRARHGDPEAAKSLLTYVGSMDAQASQRAAIELGRLKRLGKLSKALSKRAERALVMKLGDESNKTALAASIALMAF
ncbi:MAG: hypothetical protein KAI47_10405, partial [Deltaproteobacteria bacterium]|nr:hypothetical protein [Deltaproteobacteria bacterium]